MVNPSSSERHLTCASEMHFRTHFSKPIVSFSYHSRILPPLWRIMLLSKSSKERSRRMRTASVRPRSQGRLKCSIDKTSESSERASSIFACFRMAYPDAPNSGSTGPYNLGLIARMDSSAYCLFHLRVWLLCAQVARLDGVVSRACLPATPLPCTRC